MPISINLVIIRGDTTNITLTLTDQDGIAIDLTGSTVFFTVKPVPDADATDADAVIAVEVTSHTDPTNGETVIPLTADDTDIAAGIYYYDVQVKDTANNIFSLPARQLKVIEDITRRTT